MAGRFGTIYEGESLEEAKRQFVMLAGYAKNGTGYCAGEPVVFTDKGVVIEEYRPPEG